MDNTGFAAFLALGAIACSVLLGPLGRAVARWIERQSGKSEEQQALADEQLHQLSARVGELEERLDFAERLLAQQRESDRIGRGGV